jgi:hypothetical protein
MLEVFQTETGNDKQGVILVSADEYNAIAVICHCRIDMEESISILSKDMDRSSSLALWEQAEKCNLPNNHPLQPISIGSFCGLYVASALYFYNFTKSTSFTPSIPRTWFKQRIKAPYLLSFAPKTQFDVTTEEEKRNFNAMLILPDPAERFEIHVVNSCAQLSEVVTEAEFLENQDRLRIFDNIQNNAVLPEYSPLPKQVILGSNAKLIADSLTFFGLTWNLTRKYQHLPWRNSFQILPDGRALPLC